MSIVARHALALSVLAALTAPQPLWAVDLVWQGGSGEWWSAGWGASAPFGPTDTDHAFVDGGKSIDSTVSVGALGTAGQLSISGGDRVVLRNGAILFVSDVINNNGLLSLESSGGGSFVAFSANATLGGSGETRMADQAQISASLKQLTVSAGHTVSGGGSISASRIVNLGTIQATSPGGILLSAANQADSFVNTSGLVDVGDGSSVDFSLSHVSGGTLQGGGTASLRGGTLRDLELRGRLTIADGTSTAMRGTITNKGVLALASAGADTNLILHGDTTLTGGGETLFAGPSGMNNLFALPPAGAGTRLTLLDQTLRGSGSIFGIKMTNQGKIVAEGAAGIQLLLTNGTDSLLNSGGSIEVSDGSSLAIFGGTVSGGTIRGFTTSGLQSSGTLRDLTLQGRFEILESGLTLGGTVTINGTLNFGDRLSILNIAGETTLAGSGRTLLPSTQAAQYDHSIVRTPGAGASSLTVGAGHTLQGGAAVMLGAFVNEGNVVVDTAVGMTFFKFDNRQALLNRGRLRIEEGSQMTLQQSATEHNSLRQDAAGASTEVFGSLTVDEFLLEAGVLRGTGTIVGDVLNSGGTIIVGASPGKLSVQGDLMLSTGSTLEMEIGGNQQGLSYDWLAVTGDIVLGGVLHLIVSHTPALGESFELLSSAAGTIEGSFDSVLADGAKAFVTYHAQGVSVTLAPVPEASTIVLFGGGLLLVLVRRGMKIRSRAVAACGPLIDGHSQTRYLDSCINKTA